VARSCAGTINLSLGRVAGWRARQCCGPSADLAAGTSRQAEKTCVRLGHWLTADTGGSLARPDRPTQGQKHDRALLARLLAWRAALTRSSATGGELEGSGRCSRRPCAHCPPVETPPHVSRSVFRIRCSRECLARFRTSAARSPRALAVGFGRIPLSETSPYGFLPSQGERKGNSSNRRRVRASVPMRPPAERIGLRNVRAATNCRPFHLVDSGARRQIPFGRSLVQITVSRVSIHSAYSV